MTEACGPAGQRLQSGLPPARPRVHQDETAGLSPGSIFLQAAATGRSGHAAERCSGDSIAFAPDDGLSVSRRSTRPPLRHRTIAIRSEHARGLSGGRDQSTGSEAAAHAALMATVPVASSDAAPLHGKQQLRRRLDAWLRQSGTGSAQQG
jgi:hypothetical protein